MLALKQTLEADLRTRGNAEVVRVSTTEEEDFVAGLSPDTQPAEVELDASTRVKDAIRVAINNVVDLVIDGAGSGRSTHTKVDESALEERKDSHGTSGLDLGTKEAVEHAQAGTRGGPADAAGRSGTDIPLKVIGHFAFEHYVPCNVEAQSRTHTKEIRIGVFRTRHVEEDAEVAVVFIVAHLG